MDEGQKMWRGLDPIDVDTSALTTREECAEVIAAIDACMTHIDAQLSVAKQRAQAGEPVDGRWVARATVARKFYSRKRQMVQARSGEIHRSGGEYVARLWMSAAHRVLARDEIDRVWDRLRQDHPNIERAGE